MKNTESHSSSAPVAGEGNIQDAYRSRREAGSYVERRFTDEVNRLLHERQVGAVNGAVAGRSPARVLEIAPGPGRVTRDVRCPGMLVCLEYNEGMIEFGRAATAGGVSWARGNGFRLPFPQAFDLAFSFRFVRHFHRGDRARLMAEIRRVLKPGGLFLFDAVNEAVSRPLREARPEDYPIYDKLYREADLRQELAEAGFEPVALEPVQKHHRWQYLSQLVLGPRSVRLNRMVVRGLERLPSRNSLEWIVTCRRV